MTRGVNLGRRMWKGVGTPGDLVVMMIQTSPERPYRTASKITPVRKGFSATM